MSESLYRIDLLGTVITIRTEEELSYIKQLEESLAEVIKQVKEELNLDNPLSLAIMAGIYLTNENFRLKRQAPTSTLTALENKVNFEDGAERAFSQIDKLLDQTLMR
ncbi:MAG: cell division protein ZapA [Spirochaetaceae bacterium]|nr:cell division protein ZapA [Spirochaetaceae bacterium]